MNKIFRIVIICMCVQFYLGNICLEAGELFATSSFELNLPDGWVQTNTVPRGFDVGFRKNLPDSKVATFLLKSYPAPPDLQNDSGQLARQIDSMIRNQFPDARPMNAPEITVKGKVIFSNLYDLTEEGTILRRLYVQFVLGSVGFIAQCSTSPSYWDATVSDFRSILASVKSKSGAQKEKGAESVTVSKLKENLQTLIGSFPHEWDGSITNTSINRSSSEPMQTVEIGIAFKRKDIDRIYRAVKLSLRMMKEGKTSDQDFQTVPNELRAVSAEQGSGFIRCVGQIFGYVGGYALKDDSTIDRFRIVVLDSRLSRIGSVTVLRKDLLDILDKRISESDQRRIGLIYGFE